MHLSDNVLNWVIEPPKIITPTEFCETEGEGTFFENGYLDAYVHEDGCLILKVTQSKIEEWKATDYYMEILQKALGEERDIGVEVGRNQVEYDLLHCVNEGDFIISEDFTSITSTENGNPIVYGFLLVACVKMQIINGGDCSISCTLFETNNDGELFELSKFPEFIEDVE